MTIIATSRRRIWTTHEEGIGPGYDRGYRAKLGFWGHEPAEQVRLACARLPKDALCLDLGCGEGKNAAHVASSGALNVIAVDASWAALENATILHSKVTNVTWVRDDALAYLRSTNLNFDLVIEAGLLHCLPSENDAFELVALTARRLKAGGLLVLSSFNSRIRDLSGHDHEFSPIFLPHATILSSLEATGFEIEQASDTDLTDIHVHIGIPHKHSITRVLARKR